MKRDELEETVGSRIRAIRGSLTLEDFAKSIDVSRQAVAKWERDESPPKVANLDAISKVYGVETVFIAFGVVNPDSRDITERAVVEKLHLLNTQQKSLILGLINEFIRSEVTKENELTKEARKL